MPPGPDGRPNRPRPGGPRAMEGETGPSNRGRQMKVGRVVRRVDAERLRAVRSRSDGGGLGANGC